MNLRDRLNSLERIVRGTGFRPPCPECGSGASGDEVRVAVLDEGEELLPYIVVKLLRW